jgi:hypothetical protein
MYKLKEVVDNEEYECGQFDSLDAAYNTIIVGIRRSGNINVCSQLKFEDAKDCWCVYFGSKTHYFTITNENGGR